MSVFQIHYRLTVYAERSSSNRDESTILSPAANAPHSDSFKVTTLANLSGWQPYLFPPRGRRSSIDPLTKKVSVGALTFKIADFRTTAGGSNVNRWVTAFVGDITGRTRLLGLKVYVEESTDGGSSWNPFYVGRVTSFTLDGNLAYQLEVNEGNENLKVDVFDGFVSASVTSYANYQQLLPVGLPIGYGPITGSQALIGHPKALLSASTFVGREFNVNSASIANPYNVFTKEMQNRFRPNNDQAPFNYNDSLSRMIATSASITAAFIPTRMTYKATSGHYSIATVLAKNVGVNEPNYYPIESIVSGSTWRFSIISIQAPTPTNPLVINNVSPARFLKDILEGDFSRTAQFYTDTGAFTTLINDNRLPQTRWIITKKQAMNDVVEKMICQPFSLGYRTEAQLVGGVPQSVFVPFSMLLPTSSVGLTAISSSDVVSNQKPTWKPLEPVNIIDGTWYEDDTLPIQNYYVDGYAGFTTPPDITVAQVTSTPLTSQSIYINDLSLGQKGVTLDLQGIRYVEGETINGVAGGVYAAQFANQMIRNYAQMFPRSPAMVELQCLRTSNTNGCKVGDWRIVAVDVLPDPSSHTRGGSRLMQCVERSENGLTLTLKFIDSAQNIVSTAPIYNSFFTSSVFPKYQITGSLGITQSGSVQLDYACTPTSSGSAPHPTSSLWVTAFNDSAPSGTLPLSINYLPAGGRVWIRARTQRQFGSDLAFPSLWVSSSAGYVDTRTQAAPSSLLYSNINPTSVDLTWSGSVSAETFSEVLVASPSGSDSLDVIARVPPGSTRYTVSGLTGSLNPHLLGVRYGDSYGGYSTTTTVTVSLSGSLAQWPTPPAPIVLSVGSNLQ